MLRFRRLMSGTINGVPLRFVGKSAPGIRKDYRVVVWFKPTAQRKYLNLCTYQGGVAVREDPMHVVVAMALCNGTKNLSSVSGEYFFRDGKPLESNRFRNLIISVTNALFPKRVYQEDREFQRWL